MGTKVHVAIYKKPDPNSAAHWALWLNGRKSVILQIVDNTEGEDYFRLEGPIYGIKPDYTDKLDETIECGTLSSSNDIDTVASELKNQPVINRSVTWNCQDWVMEALATLSSKKGLIISSETRAILQSKRENPRYYNPRAKK